jgi:hypothetical protein
LHKINASLKSHPVLAIWPGIAMQSVAKRAFILEGAAEKLSFMKRCCAIACRRRRFKKAVAIEGHVYSKRDEVAHENAQRH